MEKIGFSGTFDPITNGHMWVINEARSLADEVVVFLSENPAKKPRFSAEERKSIIALSCAQQGWDNVQVVIVKGDYTARAAKKQGVHCLIRGIRTTADFDYENLIQQTNVDVLQGAKTIFVMPPRDLGSVSSSFVKALEGPIGWNWIMKKFVPAPAYHAWVLSWLRREWETLWDYDTIDATAIAHADDWFVRLTGATMYGGPQRHYHNLDHLVHGLCEIRVWAANTRPEPADVAIVKQAFWFHDAEYGPAASGSDMTAEEASARLWLDCHLGQEREDAAALIRATDHFQEAHVEHRLKDVLLSVDLAILGQDDEVYGNYTRAIRQEYIHLPDVKYRQERCAALAHMCRKAEAGQLFGNAYFAEQYNERAIENMQREMAQLTAA
ncbi:pantetheine-phosphate adenylyltransferase [Pseudoduganella danionis]|uniref:Phosphopantetheine adenylyltransferase n=1 Tax=Pseudoduganella danionis TaxID=1890295 RepID=A0ABW9SIR9_9BURK|nr:pantetheine-phosphate adenylyltransferase [Pseudoduganella danionis]MTW32021.1 pantetheine-phosphate adenylyltransferase [Pseudoduganella danionis]